MAKVVPDTIKVVLVDDHELLRSGLRELLACDEIEVAGEAVGGRDGVELARRLRPHVVLMDVGLPDVGGVEATRSIRSAVPDSRVLIVSMYDEEHIVEEAMLAGASGYLLKSVDPDEIVAGVRATAAGQVCLSPSIATRLIERWRSGASISNGAGSSLSGREGEVLALITEGMSNAEIAARLVISEQTVKHHVSHILGKLEVENRIQAAVTAVRQRLV